MGKFKKGDVIISDCGLYAVFDGVVSENHPVVIYSAIYDVLTDNITIKKDTGIDVEYKCILAPKNSKGRKKLIQKLSGINSPESNNILSYILGRELNLDCKTTKFYYNINCACHKNGHVEIVHHKNDQPPSVPTEIHPLFKDEISGELYKSNINNILPIKIEGEFIINNPIITDKVFNWHKCENGLPIEGDEPEENIELLIVCKESISNKIFYKTNSYKEKDWTSKYILHYEVLGWTYISKPNFIQS